MKIIYAFRRPQPHLFSIEELFGTLFSSLSFEKEKAFAPRYSNSIKNIFNNILFFNRFNSKENIVHITGDIHYVILGLLKAQTILTIHDCISLTQYSKSNPRYWFIKILWYDIPVRLATYVTVISTKTKEDLLKYTNINPQKITVIPNFVKDTFTRKTTEFNKHKPTILFLGSTPNKNVERSILALRGLNVKFLMIGKFEKQVVDLLEENKIEFSIANGLQHSEVVKAYQAADLVLFPSTYEGFGMPIIEAQAVGTAGVTSNINPLIDIAGGGACLIDPTSEDSIREGVLKVISNREYREKLIENGANNVKLFRFSTVAEMYNNIYRRCAE